MNANHRVATGLVALILVTACEVIWYPSIVVAWRGWGDSVLGYFRLLYVLPGAIVFLILAFGAVYFGWRKGAVFAGRILAIAVLANLLILVSSVIWYTHAVSEAGRYKF